MARRVRRAISVNSTLQDVQSGRPGSNRRRPAWEAARLLREIAMPATNNDFEREERAFRGRPSEYSNARGHSWAPCNRQTHSALRFPSLQVARGKTKRPPVRPAV